MNISNSRIGVLLVLLLTTTALAQQHKSNWVYQNATDTTLVPCWTDSLTTIAFPPSSMGMMMPSSMYMKIDEMPMDGLIIAHDSTFIGWYRMEAGTDSMNFTMMNDGGMGGGSMMMQFTKNLVCRFRWDSLMADSMHRNWHLTGMKGWNGTTWTSINGFALSGNVASFQSATTYSAVAFIGASSVTAVTKSNAVPSRFALQQNYPNPFNPATTIEFALPEASVVRLDVYNILGQKVAGLIDGVMQVGVHSIRFDASSMPSGVYFYKLQTGTFVQTRKMTILK